MAPISPIGVSDFREIREEGRYYVDKTELICELIASKEKALLLPRPRRFGKTLNMTMLHAFFNHSEDSRSLFEGMAVSRDAAAMAHLNGYPTLFLTLKDVTGSDWPACEKRLRDRIIELIRDHRGLLAQAADPEELERLDLLFERNSSSGDYGTALLFLTRLLHRATGKKVVLLIDEYDNPIHKGYDHGYYQEVVALMRDFLGSAIKDNSHLERAVITGIMRVAKESIYSGLNNLSVCTILSFHYNRHFGFTEAEVHQILEDHGVLDQEQSFQKWYNGYRFGGLTIYNPWSILARLKNWEDGFVPHWIGTSGNALIEKLVRSGQGIEVQDLEKLLNGEQIQRKIQEPIALADITKTHDSVWGLLFFSGYLTTTGVSGKKVSLRIPNEEIRTFFADFLVDWLGSPSSVQQLISHLLQEQWQEFAVDLSAALSTILSYHDTGKDRGEWVYHVFVAGLLANLLGTYRVQSNRQSGTGRYDLALIPTKPGDPGFVLEFKRPKEGERDLAQLAQIALAQIETQDYAAQLREQGVSRIAKLGIGILGTSLALAATTTNETTGTQTPVLTCLAGPEPKFRSRRKRAESSGSATDPNKSSNPQTTALCFAIQALQEAKGLTVTPMVSLSQMEPLHLNMILQALSN